jgi:hypothetical protein
MRSPGALIARSALEGGAEQPDPNLDKRARGRQLTSCSLLCSRSWLAPATVELAALADPGGHAVELTGGDLEGVADG